MSRYIISLPASQDLRAISNYFAGENVAAGERLLIAFNRKCE
jgi:plasmid stabilization system protein ParE